MYILRRWSHRQLPYKLNILLHTYVHEAKRNFLLAFWFEPYFSSFRFCSIYWFYYILLLFIFHLVVDFFIYSCVSLLIVFCWHFVGSKLNKCIYFNISSLAQCVFFISFYDSRRISIPCMHIAFFSIFSFILFQLRRGNMNSEICVKFPK